MNSKQPDPFNKPESIKLMLRIFYGVCAVLVITELLIHGHTQHDWEKLPAFYAVFALLVCGALTLIAKLLARIVKRKQDYYDA